MIKLGELVMILDLHRQGLTVSAIARQLSMDRKTVRRYIERGLEPPAYGPRSPQPRSTDFIPAVSGRAADGLSRPHRRSAMAANCGIGVMAVAIPQ